MTETHFCPATPLGPRKTILFCSQLFVYCSAPGSNSRVPEALLLLKLNQNFAKKKKNHPNCFCLFELGLDTVTKTASPSSTGGGEGQPTAAGPALTPLRVATPSCGPEKLGGLAPGGRPGMGTLENLKVVVKK